MNGMSRTKILLHQSCCGKSFGRWLVYYWSSLNYRGCVMIQWKWPRCIGLDQELLQAVNCDTRGLCIDCWSWNLPISHWLIGLAQDNLFNILYKIDIDPLLCISLNCCLPQKKCKIFEAWSVIWNLQTLASLISRMVLLTYRPAMHLAQVDYNQYTETAHPSSQS